MAVSIVEDLNNIKLSQADINKLWDNAIDDLVTKLGKPITVGPVVAASYRYDLHGLFISLGLLPYQIYPHIRINGYNSSRCYNGDKTTFVTIDEEFLNNLYKTFLRNKNNN